MKTGTVSTIPDKPGTMIDPGFVSYTGAVPEVRLTESAERTSSLVVSLITGQGFTSGANGDQSTVFD